MKYSTYQLIAGTVKFILGIAVLSNLAFGFPYLNTGTKEVDPLSYLIQAVIFAIALGFITFQENRIRDVNKDK